MSIWIKMRYQCERVLFPHLYVCTGCRGDKETNECLLKYYGKHEDALRELIINNDHKGVEEYFNMKTGAWYND